MLDISLVGEQRREIFNANKSMFVTTVRGSCCLGAGASHVLYTGPCNNNPCLDLSPERSIECTIFLLLYESTFALSVRRRMLLLYSSRNTETSFTLILSRRLIEAVLPSRLSVRLFRSMLSVNFAKKQSSASQTRISICSIKPLMY